MHAAIDVSATKLFGAGTTTYIQQLLKSLSELPDRPTITEFCYDPLFSKKSRLLRAVDTIIREVFWLQGALPLQLRTSKPDIFHSPVMLAPLNCPVPLVLTVLDLYIIRHPEAFPAWQSRIFRSVLPMAVRRADAILTISEFTKEELLDCFPDLDPGKVLVTLLAADEFFIPAPIETVCEFRTRMNLRKPYVLGVSTIEPRKNLPRLLEAFSLIANQFDHELVLAGAAGWKSGDLARLIKSFGLTERVRFLGYIEKAYLPAAYTGAAAFAYVSLYEGFGLPTLEAMACGCPVVASSAASLPEVVGNSALLVDPLSAEDIARGLSIVLGNDLIRENLIKSGRERSLGFTWRHCAEQTMNAYRIALSRRTSGLYKFG